MSPFKEETRRLFVVLYDFYLASDFYYVDFSMIYLLQTHTNVFFSLYFVSRQLLFLLVIMVLIKPIGSLLVEMLALPFPMCDKDVLLRRIFPSSHQSPILTKRLFFSQVVPKRMNGFSNRRNTKMICVQLPNSGTKTRLML